MALLEKITSSMTAVTSANAHGYVGQAYVNNNVNFTKLPITSMGSKRTLTVDIPKVYRPEEQLRWFLSRGASFTTGHLSDDNGVISSRNTNILKGDDSFTDLPTGNSSRGRIRRWILNHGTSFTTTLPPLDPIQFLLQKNKQNTFQRRHGYHEKKKQTKKNPKVTFMTKHKTEETNCNPMGLSAFTVLNFLIAAANTVTNVLNNNNNNDNNNNNNNNNALNVNVNSNNNNNNNLNNVDFGGLGRKRRSIEKGANQVTPDGVSEIQLACLLLMDLAQALQHSGTANLEGINGWKNSLGPAFHPFDLSSRLNGSTSRKIFQFTHDFRMTQRRYPDSSYGLESLLPESHQENNNQYQLSGNNSKNRGRSNYKESNFLKVKDNSKDNSITPISMVVSRINHNDIESENSSSRASVTSGHLDNDIYQRIITTNNEQNSTSTQKRDKERKMVLLESKLHDITSLLCNSYKMADEVGELTGFLLREMTEVFLLPGMGIPTALC